MSALLSSLPTGVLLAGQADVSLDVIVRDGDAATGTDGVFDLDDSANAANSIAIDGTARVYFYASTDADEPPVFNVSGVWVGTGEFINDIAIDGQSLSLFQPDPEDCDGVGDICGIIFNTQADFHVTHGGDITLRTSREDLNPTVAFLSGFERTDLAPLLQDSSAPNFPYSPTLGLRSSAGQFLIGPYIGSEAFGEPGDGLVDFVTPFIGSAPPFILDPVTITAIYGTYASAAGVTFGYNNAADRLFIAKLSDNSEALYFDPMAAGPSRLLAHTGQTTPGIPIGEFVELSQSLTAGQAGNARLNDAAQGYFRGTWYNPGAPVNNSNLPRQALWRFDASEGPELVVSEYLNFTTDPDFDTSEFANTAFDNLSVPNIGPNGEVWFFATGRFVGIDGIPDTDDEREGLWRATPGSPPELVLRKTTSDSPGSPLPNGPNVPGTLLPGGERFTGFGPDTYALDGQGYLLFSTPNAIYAEDEFGIRLVLKVGDEVEVSPGVNRTVAQARINTLGHVSGQTPAFRQGRLALRVRFTDNSRAIIRTAFLDPPPPPELVGLEAVQVVQDWENSVRLYRGKQTIVRAHLRAQEAELKKVLLRVYDGDDNELPFSPLAPQAPAGLVLAGPESLMKREAKWASANFVIPTAATQATVLKFKVELEDENLACEETAGPVARDCRLEVTLFEPFKPELKVVSLNWKSPDHPRVDRRGRIDVVQRIISAYPFAEVDWTDGEVPFDVDMTLGTSLEAITKPLVHLWKMRQLDKCTDKTGCKRLYLGLLRGQRILGAGPPSWKVAAGFIDPNPRTGGRHTMTHELGHLLDRPHSIVDPPIIRLNDNGHKQGPCGSVAEVSAAQFPFIYFVPYPSGPMRQTLGPILDGDDKLVYGWDSMQRLVVDPFQVFDLMGYCRDNVIGRWPSTHTYKEVADATEDRFGTTAGLGAGLPDQDYWSVNGSVFNARVSLDPLLRIDDAQPPDASPAGDWRAESLDAGDTVLDFSEFAPEIVQATGGDYGYLFSAVLPVDALAVKIRILDPDSQPVAEIEASANPPTVTILSPNGNETLSGDTTELSWQAQDADGDPLVHAVQFSHDGGTNWETLAADYGGTTIELVNESLPATGQGLFRVISSDGFHQAGDESDAVFTVPNGPPGVLILSPGDQRTFYGDDPIDLGMYALDTEDGELTGGSLSWTSDQDGLLGVGNSLLLAASDLTPGTHLLTAQAQDSGGLIAEDQVTLMIETQRPETLADLSVTLLTDRTGPPTANQPIAFSAVIENLGDDAASAGFSFEAVLSALTQFPGPQAVLDGLEAPPGWNCSISSLTVDCSTSSFDPYQRVELTFDLTLDRPADLQAGAEIDSPVDDPDGGNNQSTLVYRVDRSLLVFEDGFEPAAR